MKIEVPAKDAFKYWAMVIDGFTNRVCTVYPTNKPHGGLEYQARRV